MSAYMYVVSEPGGRPIMQTEYENLRYPPEIELQMLNLGYKITINGKRLTKKEATDAAAKPNRKKK